MINIQRNLLNLKQINNVSRYYAVISYQREHHKLLNSDINKTNAPVSPMLYSQYRFFGLSSKLSDAVKNVPESSIADVGYIPEPPSEIMAQKAELLLNQLGEPTFSSLGLNSYSPVGFAQYILENVHVLTGLPWWCTILLTAVVVKISLIPVVIKSRIFLPEIQKTMQNFQEIESKRKMAVIQRDPLVLMEFYQRNAKSMEDVNVWKIFKNAGTPMMQGVVMLSFFNGLRGMVNTPVASLQSGGPSLFADLTSIDPLYLAPGLTATSIMFIVMTNAAISAQDLSRKKYYALLIGGPAIMFLFLMKSSSAVCLYFLANNLCSSGINFFLSRPAVNNYFGLPKLELPTALMTKSMSSSSVQFNRNFFSSMKDYYKSKSAEGKIFYKVDGMAKLDEQKWQSAAKAPVKKTFKYDPTKSQNLKASNK